MAHRRATRGEGLEPSDGCLPKPCPVMKSQGAASSEEPPQQHSHDRTTLLNLYTKQEARDASNAVTGLCPGPARCTGSSRYLEDYCNKNTTPRRSRGSPMRAPLANHPERAGAKEIIRGRAAQRPESRAVVRVGGGCESEHWVSGAAQRPESRAVVRVPPSDALRGVPDAAQRPESRAVVRAVVGDHDEPTAARSTTAREQSCSAGR